jgi:hypothetical protein
MLGDITVILYSLTSQYYGYAHSDIHGTLQQSLHVQPPCFINTLCTPSVVT